MSARSESKTPIVIVAVIAIIIVSALIPYKTWDHAPSPERYCVEGQVASIDGNTITVNIDTARGENQNPTFLGAYVVLQGSVPDYCRTGQAVIISIHRGSSLFDKIDKSVEVSFYRDTNVLMGMIVPMVAPFRTDPSSLTLKELHPNGTLLLYYGTRDR